MIYREILSICRAATRAVGVVACYLIPSLRWIRILSATDTTPSMHNTLMCWFLVSF